MKKIAKGLVEMGRLLKPTYKNWKARDPFRQSAIIAYYAVFSLPGLLVVVLSLASYFIERKAVDEHLRAQIQSALGSDTADQIQNLIQRAEHGSNSFWAAALGVIVILIGATGVFVQLQKSLNTIWEVKAEPKKSGIVMYLKSRLFSFGVILAIAFLLLISLVISSVLTAMSEWIKAVWPDLIMFLFQAINFILSLGIITLLFAVMFKVLPDIKIKWRHLWAGAILTALLFVIGKTALGLYFGKAEPAEGYGPAGSIVLVLMWVSYSSMIVFFGAEFTRLYANRHQGEVKPGANAVKDKGEMRSAHPKQD